MQEVMSGGLPIRMCLKNCYINISLAKIYRALKKMFRSLLKQESYDTILK